MKKYSALAFAMIAGTWFTFPLVGQARTAREICGSYAEFIQKDQFEQMRQYQNRRMDFCHYHYQREIRDAVYELCIQSYSQSTCGCFNHALHRFGLSTLSRHFLHYPGPPTSQRVARAFERCQSSS